MLEDFLSKLGASTRITVGVAVSPGLGIEMIEVDRTTATVTKYAFKPLEYNTSAREISDYNQFKIALEELFEELHIPKKSNIILSLPSVHFGTINLPLLLTDEAITNAIVSEVEQSYIFKRQDPVVGWCEITSNPNTENRSIAYTAIQKSALEQITEICTEIGCTLAGLEDSYSSLFRALHFLGTAKEQMENDVNWNLMVIMQNNYSIISMNGKKIIEYYEEPLALKSFVDDEIYNAIKTSAQLTLASLPATHLLIVSETDLVSAEVLAMKMGIQGSVSFLECNKYIQNELMPISLDILPKTALKLTSEAVGVGIFTFCDFPLKLNIIKGHDASLGLLGDTAESPRINIGNVEVELTPDFIKKLSLIAGAVLIIPMILTFFIINNVVTPKEQAKLDEINAKVANLTKEIDAYKQASQNTAFDAKTTIENITGFNENKLTYYSALGVTVPNSLWLTYYRITPAGKVDIRGESNDVKSVYTFYKNLKQTVDNSDVRLHRLEIKSGTIDDLIGDNINSNKLYIFEITNMTEAELNPSSQTSTESTTPAAAPTQPAESQQRAPFGLGKPLFGTNSTPDAPSSTPAATPAAAPAQTPAATPAPASNTTNQPSYLPPESQQQLPQNLKKIEKF